MNGLMVRKKKYRFQVEVRVEELQHVPFVNQVLFAKVRLLDGGFTDLSPRMMVAEHAVRWDSRFSFTCKMTANASTGELDSCMCRVSVRQEVRGGKSFQKLGYADVNLAEFAGSGGCQRYLLEAYDSKHRLHNSMLKVTVDMTLLSGDPCFKAQPSRVTRYQQPAAGEAGAEEVPPSRPTSGSLASLTSSGYDSLKKKVNEVLDSEDGEGGGGGWVGGEMPGGHSRNSSNTSHASGYASINSQSEKSGHIRNSSAGSGGGGSSEGGGCGSSMGGSLERPSHPTGSARLPVNPPTTQGCAEEASKKSRVDDTRIDADDIIDKLFQDTNIEELEQDDSAEASTGLQLYIGRDGSATLGGKTMDTRVEYKPVVIEKR